MQEYSLLIDFNQNWNALTNVILTPPIQIHSLVLDILHDITQVISAFPTFRCEHVKIRLVQQVTVPSFESGTCQSVNRNADHSTTTFHLITENVLERTEETKQRVIQLSNYPGEKGCF
jgi:hypothetical protein